MEQDILFKEITTLHQKYTEAVRNAIALSEITREERKSVVEFIEYLEATTKDPLTAQKIRMFLTGTGIWKPTTIQPHDN